MNLSQNKKLILILFLSLLSVGFFKFDFDTFSFYKQPLHYDELVSVGFANDLVEKGEINNIDSFLSYPKLKDEYFYKYGIYILIAELKLFGINLIDSFYILHFLIFLLIIYTAYFSIKHIYNEKIAFYSSIFLIFSKTTFNNLLGIHYLIPLSLAIFCLFIYGYFSKNFNENIFLLLFILSMTLIIHPPIFFILLICFIIQLFIFKSNTFQYKNQFFYIFLTIINFGIFIFINLKDSGYELIKKYLFLTSNRLVTEYGSNIKFYLIGGSYLSFISYLGLFLIILSILGFYYNRKSNSFFNILVVVVFMQLILEVFFNKGIFIQIHRITNLLMVSLVPFASLGIDIIQTKYFKKEYFKSIFIFLIFTIVILNFGLYTNNVKSDDFFNSLVSQNKISTIYSLDNITNSTIFADFFLSSMIYPYTNNKVIASLRISYFDIYNDFISSSCDKKTLVLNLLNVDYFIDDCESNCNFDKVINNPSCIYFFNKTNMSLIDKLKYYDSNYDSNINKTSISIIKNINNPYNRSDLTFYLNNISDKNDLVIELSSFNSNDKGKLIIKSFSLNKKFVISYKYLFKLNEKIIINLDNYSEANVYYSDIQYDARNLKINKDEQLSFVLSFYPEDEIIIKNIYLR